MDDLAACTIDTVSVHFKRTDLLYLVLSLLADCFCSLSFYKDATSTGCGHIFCNGCISRCLARETNSARCPLCNSAVKKRSLVKLSVIDEMLKEWKEVVVPLYEQETGAGRRFCAKLTPIAFCSQPFITSESKPQSPPASRPPQQPSVLPQQHLPPPELCTRVSCRPLCIIMRFLFRSILNYATPSCH